MSNKCFCHLDGYELKDATARRDIETLKNDANTFKTQIEEGNNEFKTQIQKDQNSFKSAINTANDLFKQQIIDENNTFKKGVEDTMEEAVSGLATEEYVDNAVSGISIDGVATEEYVDSAIASAITSVLNTEV